MDKYYILVFSQKLYCLIMPGSIVDSLTLWTTVERTYAMSILFLFFNLLLKDNKLKKSTKLRI